MDLAVGWYLFRVGALKGIGISCAGLFVGHDAMIWTRGNDQFLISVHFPNGTNDCIYSHFPRNACNLHAGVVQVSMHVPVGGKLPMHTCTSVKSVVLASMHQQI